jgi:membrane protein implicated in regulation of membrane protease activity
MASSDAECLSSPRRYGGTYGEPNGALAGMMAVATLFAALFTSAGMMISYTIDLPTGSVIIVFAGAVYLLALAGRAILRRTKRAAAQMEEV